MDSQENMQAALQDAWTQFCERTGTWNPSDDIVDAFKAGFAAGGQYALKTAAPFELKRENNGR